MLITDILKRQLKSAPVWVEEGRFELKDFVYINQVLNFGLDVCEVQEEGGKQLMRQSSHVDVDKTNH